MLCTPFVLLFALFCLAMASAAPVITSAERARERGDRKEVARLKEAALESEIARLSPDAIKMAVRAENMLDELDGDSMKVENMLFKEVLFSGDGDVKKRIDEFMPVLYALTTGKLRRPDGSSRIEDLSAIDGGARPTISPAAAFRKAAKRAEALIEEARIDAQFAQLSPDARKFAAKAEELLDESDDADAFQVLDQAYKEALPSDLPVSERYDEFAPVVAAVLEDKLRRPDGSSRLAQPAALSAAAGTVDSSTTMPTRATKTHKCTKHHRKAATSGPVVDE